MKRPVFLICLLFSVSAVIAQKDFEGALTYRHNIVSKSEVSNATWKKILNESDEMTTIVKDGNFRQSSDKSEGWVFPQKGRSYMKFKGYDTLYWSDVSDDTANLLSVTKDAATRTIAGYNCNSITIRTTAATYTYFYSPSLHRNPELTKNYRMDREDVFAKETSSLYLAVQEDNKLYTSTSTCIKVEQKPVDASVFDLPNLPQKQLTRESFAASFLRLPEFSGKEGWLAFLEKQLDKTVAAKYVKIGRKESAASQTVYVTFTVSETGNVLNAAVDNKKEVPSKLADEALRVINISHWHPATVFNQPIPYKMTQPITFQVTKE